MATTHLRKSDTSYDKIALQLGHITIEWGHLERMLDDLIVELGRLDETHVAQIITGNSDIRSKIQMAKGLSFIRKSNEDWFIATIGLLDIIDNDLRPRRNEVTHGRWQMPKGQIHRVTYKTKLLKPQSFQQILETEQRVPIKVSQLKTLRKRIRSAWIALLMSTLAVVRPESIGGQNPLPSKSFRRWFRQQGFGNLLSNANSTRKRPRGSFPALPRRIKLH